jgi:hypothetical protein
MPSFVKKNIPDFASTSLLPEAIFAIGWHRTKKDTLLLTIFVLNLISCVVSRFPWASP